jgi:flagellar hook-associated protein 1 FlgK
VSNLLTSLTSATRALEAQRFGLDVTGHNIANINTPGYSRRVADFEAVPPDTLHSAGRGVQVSGVRAQRDRLIERRLELETTGAEREAALADLLSLAEVAIGNSGQGLDTRLNAFFDGMSRLADAPTSAVARQEVMLQGTAVAAAFRDTASHFEALRRDADDRLEGLVEQVNEIAAEIAVLNRSMGAVGASGTRPHLQDEQAQLVKQLAALTDITVIGRDDGGVDIDIAGGRALVVGDASYDLVATAVGPSGRIAVSTAGVDITAQLAGGKIGGVLSARDVQIPDYLQRLDEQAFAFADAVNTIHSAGYDLNGATGQDFFAFTTPPVGSTGAAAALIVDPAITADSSRIAAAEVAIAGDNRAARDMANLRDARLLDGGTATLADAWGQLVFRVGRDVETATNETTLRRQILLQLEALRDQVSGVSLDEEAMLLMKYQRAYEANARFFRVIDDALQTLINSMTR